MEITNLGIIDQVSLVKSRGLEQLRALNEIHRSLNERKIILKEDGGKNKICNKFQESLQLYIFYINR